MIRGIKTLWQTHKGISEKCLSQISSVLKSKAFIRHQPAIHHMLLIKDESRSTSTLDRALTFTIKHVALTKYQLFTITLLILPQTASLYIINYTLNIIKLINSNNYAKYKPLVYKYLYIKPLIYKQSAQNINP